MKTLIGRVGALLAAGLLSVFTSTLAIAQGASPEALRHAQAVQERHTDALLRNAAVVGTAVGIRAEGVPVIKVYAERAGVRGIPAQLDGVPVVVEVTGRIVAFAKPPGTPGKGGGGDDDGGGGDGDPAGCGAGVDPTSRYDRPVPIGVSTGHPLITAGTIGARVVDGGGNVYALSNNHVYADENAATLGDNVLQPGTYDGGTVQDDVGSLFDYEPIDFSPSGSNVIDAAIALSTVTELCNATPPDGYGRPRSQTVPAKVGMRVQKYGRTTGFTKGFVDAVNATVSVGYGTGTALFVGQIVIKPGGFSQGGDSGSLIVVQKGRNARSPVGLLFAGSSTITVANPIDAALGRFGVTIDGD